MNTELSILTFNMVSSNISDLASASEAVKAIGVSGSHARGSADKLSDIDFCVYVRDKLPAANIREQIYSELGFDDVIYFDIDFGTSCGDGFWVNGVRCDFNWMSIPMIQSYLNQLDSDFECSEYLAGGIKIVKGLYDPDNIIPKLQLSIPNYSNERAKTRIKLAIEETHFSMYELGWLEKAAYRRDSYLFLTYKKVVLETLFRALFAINKIWLSDEKDLINIISGFQYIPDNFENRVNSIILHQNESIDLEKCLLSIKKLIADTVRVIHQQYPDIKLPFDWH
jgi:predicted nucleotidyltransferase